MRTKLLLAILFLGAQAVVSAQGLKLGDNPAVLHPASLLELESTSLVFVPTRMNTGQMNAITPLDGALIYNSQEEGLYYYDNSTWSAVGNVREEADNIFAGDRSGDANSGLRNAAFGFRAMEFNASGNNNTAMGRFSLRNNLNASNNSAFGYNALSASNAALNSAFGAFALESNSTGANNSAFGVSSLRSHQSGANNSAFGLNALRGNVSGNNNSAFGVGSLQVALGSANSAFGRFAMQQLINGNNNVAVGNTAGRLTEDGSNLTNVANSVFIGNNARSQANGQDNQIVIGNGAIGNGANTVTIGNSDITNNFFNGNVDITGQFMVNGTPISGGTGLTNPLTEDLDAAGFNIINVNRFGVSNDSRSVYIGENSGIADNTSRAVVGVGFEALRDYDGGGSVVAVGDGALTALTTGTTNTGVGNQAMLSLRTGGDNSTLGHKSMERNIDGSRNSVVGSKALRHSTTGNNNTVMGYEAARFVSIGGQNLAMENGVMIGSNAYPEASGGINEIVIGAGARGNGSNTVTIGNDTITDVHLGSGYIFSADAAPASSSAPGETGEIRIDSNFFYVCVAPNSWVRASLSSW